MLPDPLHPALVHFPVVFAFLAPPLAAVAYWAIRSGRSGRRLWLAVVGFQLLLVGASWFTMEAGEDEEERVEQVVAERHIEAHEEDAERFQLLAVGVLVLAGVGLLANPIGAVAQALTIVLSLAAATAAGLTGHSGGELVYRHGAASAYLPTTPGRVTARSADGLQRVEHEDDDD